MKDGQKRLLVVQDGSRSRREKQNPSVTILGITLDAVENGSLIRIGRPSNKHARAKLVPRQLHKRMIHSSLCDTLSPSSNFQQDAALTEDRHPSIRVDSNRPKE